MRIWSPACIAGLAASCVLSAGCSGGGPERAAPAEVLSGSASPSLAPVTDTATDDGTTIVGHVWMQGSLGAAVDFSTDTASARIDPYDPQTVRVESWDPARHWWVMTAFHLPVRLDDPSMHTGVVIEEDVSSGDDSDGGLIFSPVGCEGPAPGDYQVDTRGRALTLQVLPGTTPETHTQRFEVTFGSGGWRLQGGFEYRP